MDYYGKISICIIKKREAEVKMKVLVTGGAGFVGSNIAREASRRGFEVRVLDNLSLGSQANLTGIDNLEFIKGDVMDEETVKNSMKDIDYVFHQAAASSSPMFVPDPRKGININLEGFQNVLEHASRNKVRKVVYAMTSSSYGNLPVPWKESDLTLKTNPSAYAYSLYARSFLANLYSEQRGLGTTGLVYFSVYGPFEQAKGRFANVASQFLWAMKAGEQPTVYGDGTQARDYVNVSDVVEANFLASTSKVTGDFFNVGTGIEISMLKTVDILNQIIGTKIKPLLVPNPIAGYCYRTLANTTKAKEILGFEARVTFEEGLRSAIQFYDKSKSDN
jgi:UDP-glucose 4-epimerase